MKLVSLIDRLLDILARDPAYRYYMLDGQTIVLEDYIEARPDHRQELMAHIASGRILIGPWYVLPDEFLVSGESLIRNLQAGHRLSREYGHPMKVGYLPDQFGHIAQMPQLLRGFDIDSAVIWRGVGDAVKHTEFFWESPDGSGVLTLHLPSGYFDSPDLPCDREHLLAHLAALRRRLEPRATTEYLVVMNGADHAFPQSALPTILETANANLADAQLVHGNLPSLIDGIKRTMSHNGAVWETITGELRDCSRAHLLPGVASTRMWIKQRNAACENLLEKWAEPFSAWASVEADGVEPGLCHPTSCRRGDAAGRPQTKRERWRSTLRLAWKYLLQNHPHDSICGCSVDQVHEEMRTRFAWSEQIARAVADEALQALIDRVDTRRTRQVADNAARIDEPGETTSVVVFNPLAGPRTDFVTVSLPPTSCGEWQVVDEQGQPQPSQVLPGTDDREGLHLGFVASEVPGHGYRTFWLEPMPRGTTLPTGADWKAEEGHVSPAMVIENEFLGVVVDGPTGTIGVIDKETGREYHGLNRFVDEGDAGDEYNYSPPAHDAIVSGLTAPPTVTSVENGPARFTVRVDSFLQLPGELSADRQSRSAHSVRCRVVSDISLYPGVKRVDLHVGLDNQARDHRLRVHFPTGMAAETAHAEGHFAIVERAVHVPPTADGFVEQPVGAYPQKTFVDVSDGMSGLAVANQGLSEYEVLPEAKSTTIALTLLRCVGWLSRDDLRSRRGHAGPGLPTPGAQCLGESHFDYSLIPHEGNWQRALPVAHRFSQPLRAMAYSPRAGHMPSSLGFIKVQPDDLVVSAIKLPEHGEGVVVRLYNPTSRPTRGHIILHRRPSRAKKVNLEETGGSDLALRASGDGIEFEAGPSEILTFRFEFEQRETPSFAAGRFESELPAGEEE